jgi:hypothetical protein
VRPYNYSLFFLNATPYQLKVPGSVALARSAADMAARRSTAAMSSPAPAIDPHEAVPLVAFLRGAFGGVHRDQVIVWPRAMDS